MPVTALLEDDPPPAVAIIEPDPPGVGGGHYESDDYTDDYVLDGEGMLIEADPPLAVAVIETL